jgi:hypothetical protein
VVLGHVVAGVQVGDGLRQVAATQADRSEWSDFTGLNFKVRRSRGGIKIFKALARLASNSKCLLAKSEKNSPKSCLCVLCLY